MLFLLGRRTSEEYEQTTPAKLSEEFDIRLVRGLRRVHLQRHDDLVRYGLSCFPIRDSLVRNVVNTAIGIDTASNKLTSLELLASNGIPVPQIFRDRRQIRASDLPLFRRRAYHSRGTDIKVVTSLDNIPSGDYYIKYIKAIREYRVLVFGNEALRVQLKWKENEDKNQRILIRNSSHDYKFLNIYHHWLNTERNMIPIAIRSVQECGLDFGAVDIIIDKDKHPFVLEVNSAPRLNRSGRELFVLALMERLGRCFDINICERIVPNNRLSLPVRFITEIEE
jgi:hypothetical protein